MLGASEPLWTDAGVGPWRRTAPLAVIAGSLPIGLSRAMGRLPGTNDGVVRLEETSLPGMSAQLVMPVAHGGMLVSARVAHQVIAFLRNGAFDAAAL